MLHHLDDGRSGGAGAVQDDLHIGDVLAHHLERIEQSCSHHHGGAVLVVMEHGDVQLAFQHFFDFEAVGGLDVFQVNAAEAGCDGLHRRDDFFGGVCVDADREGIHAAEALEQHALAFHDGQGRGCADVAQAQHRGAVGNHRDGIGLAGVTVGIVDVLRDLAAGLGYAGGIRDGKIVDVFDGKLCYGFDLALGCLMTDQGLCVEIQFCSFSWLCLRCVIPHLQAACILPYPL